MACGSWSTTPIAESDVNELDRRLVDIGLRGYLPSLVKERPHGGVFLYRSSETDVLGWACENAAGTPMQTLMSEISGSRSAPNATPICPAT